MSINQFIVELRAQGVQLVAEGEQLIVRAPKGALTPAQRNQLVEHKADILAALLQPIGPQEGFYPLSEGQKTMWIQYQLAPDSAAYNVTPAWRITSPLNVEALRGAFQTIIDRHPPLRATFKVVEGAPMQYIRASHTLDFAAIDASSWDSDQLEDHLKAEMHRPFDLQQGPLLRVRLYRESQGTHILLLAVHHIAFDNWSNWVLLGELNELYGAVLGGRSTHLPSLTMSYLDFIQAERVMLAGPEGERLRNYWQQKLAGELPVLNLLPDRPRPPIQTFVGASYVAEFSHNLTQKLKALAQTEGVTLYVSLLTAFYILLYRYTWQEDIIVGSPMTSRTQAEYQKMIGYFVNATCLRTNLSGDPSFRVLLKQVRQLVFEALAHQNYPTTLLAKDLHQTRDLSYASLFQAMFILNKPQSSQRQTVSLADQADLTVNIELGNLTLEALPLKQDTTMVDITLLINELQDSLFATWQYNTDLFDTKTISRMANHYGTLLEAIVTDPDRPISEYPLLTPAEEHQLLVTWNDAKGNYSTDDCVHHLFEEQAAKNPTRVAVVAPASGPTQRREITYQRLNQQANQLAHFLKKQNLGPEAVVGVYLEKSIDTIISVLAILKAGATYLPLDLKHPQDRLAYILSDSQATMVITQTGLLENLPVNSASIICLDNRWAEISQEADDNPTSQVNSKNLVYVIYTSGSTGQSKGVLIEHRNLVNAYRAWLESYQLNAEDIHLQMANFAFDVFSGDFVRALCAGGRLVLCPQDVMLVPEKLYQLMRQEQVNCAEFVPVVLRHLIQYLDNIGQTLDFMKILACGSDSWYVEEYRSFLQHCGPETRLINSYGLTEATIDSTFFEESSSNLISNQLVPIGKPFLNTEIYILDSHLNPTPIGVVGELHIGGLGVARGYLNRPDLTQARFVANPFSHNPESRLYKTGDLARYLPDGNIEFIGRLDDQVKIRGFRVELGEIEATLEQHPSVQEVAVIARGDQASGKKLLAYFVPAPAHTITPGDLREFLKQKLPDYMIPAAFISLDKIPLSPNGKIDRRALPEPDQSHLAVEQQFIAPQTDIEQRLAEIWREVLQVERVGINDNFFDLGGHSLLIAQLQGQLEQNLNLTLPIVKLFQYPTIASLAQYLSQTQDQLAQETATRQKIEQRVQQQKSAMMRQKLQRNSR